MFIGHYAPAFVAAGTRRGPKLAAMFVAAQLVDIAYFGLILAGIEHMRETPGHTVMSPGDFYHMPYTHSLLGSIGFAAAWAAATRLMRRDWRAAWIGAAVVLSHWFLDLLVHAPDLTILGEGTLYGFALWNHPAIEMPLELGLTAITFAFYLSRTRARSRQGHIAPAFLALTLLALQLVNWFGGQPTRVVDPVPATTPLTALFAYALLAALAWWTSRVRQAPAGASVTPL